MRSRRSSPASAVQAVPHLPYCPLCYFLIISSGQRKKASSEESRYRVVRGCESRHSHHLQSGSTLLLLTDTGSRSIVVLSDAYARQWRNVLGEFFVRRARTPCAECVRNDYLSEIRP